MRAQVFFLLVTGCLLLSCKKETATAPEAAKLPFPIVHTHGDNATSSSQLAILDRAGNDRVVVDSVGINNYPSWSPSGRHIVFQGNRGRPTEIYIVNADGSNERNLTNNPDFDEHPIWSPDGSMILFRSYRDSKHDLYVMDTLGQNLRDITPFPLHNDQPSWARNGRITYVGNREGNNEIYVTDPMGFSTENATNTPNENENVPSWNPDGTTIAYILNRQLYTLVFPGGLRHQLTSQPDSLVASSPQWSPDGTYILYQTNGNAIYRINNDGSAAIMLTSDPATPGIADHGPRWSPDGSLIVFTSYRTGTVQLFVMAPDGSGAQQLTTSAGGNAIPSWAPR